MHGTIWMTPPLPVLTRSAYAEALKRGHRAMNLQGLGRAYAHELNFFLSLLKDFLSIPKSNAVEA